MAQHSTFVHSRVFNLISQQCTGEKKCKEKSKRSQINVKELDNMTDRKKEELRLMFLFNNRVKSFNTAIKMKVSFNKDLYSVFLKNLRGEFGNYVTLKFERFFFHDFL